MAFTSSTTLALLKYGKAVSYKLELKTNFAESTTWLEYAWEDFALANDANAPALLRISLCNDDLDMSDESSPGNRVQLFAQVRLTATVGSESEVLFDGRVFSITPTDYALELTAQDWLALANDCACEVSLAPTETSEIATRQISLVGGGDFGSTYGFSYNGSGDDAFNQDTDPGTRRRSFAPGDIALWYDSGKVNEVPPQHYQVNLASGTATILEDTAGNSYYASGVRCYVESTLDWAEVFKAALKYPAVDGGMGLGDSDLDMPDTGLDIAGPVYFLGKVGDLVREILSRQQQNLRLHYDSANQKYKLQVVLQKAASSEDWQLIHPQRVSQPRNIANVYSRVVVTGQSERPRNALTESATSISDITTSGDWFEWDGLNVGSDSTFALVSPNLYDGDANLGAAVHNLPATEGGGTDRYDSWYNFIEVDLGSVQRISRVRAVMPGSRNANAAAGHQGLFWPGLKLYSSIDGVDFRLLSTHTAGRFAPGQMVEAQGNAVLYPKARYLKVTLGAYKHGFDNQADPSIGLAELAVYITEEYSIAKEIDPLATPASSYSYTADYDRDGVIDTWSRNHPDLWTRLGARHRTLFDDQAGRLNEFLAHDRAIDLLAESVRLFQQVEYLAVCDPRIRLYSTVVVDDELNGDIGSILVERVVLKPSGTRISGTNYLAGALG